MSWPVQPLIVRERPSYTPTIVTTIFLGIFGLWPAIRHSRMARERGYSTGGYWVAFWVPMVVPVVVIVVLAAAFLAAFSGQSSTPTTALQVPIAAATSQVAVTPSVSAASATSGSCGYTVAATAPAARSVGLPPDPTTTPTGNRTIHVTTNLGALTFSLDGAQAPCNVQSISYLASKGFFDGTSCNRLVTSGIYVLQCGDPTGGGAGGPGYSAKDENLSSASYSQVGTIAMANAGPNTNGSQFFIIYQDSSVGLDKLYTVIGTVTAGMDIVQRVAAAGSDNRNSTGDGRPNLAITLVNSKVD